MRKVSGSRGKARYCDPVTILDKLKLAPSQWAYVDQFDGHLYICDARGIVWRGNHSFMV
jgi:hypothetical protein